MSFQITCYLYSYYRNPSVSNSFMLRDDANGWFVKKIAPVSLGICLELAPCVLVTATIARVIFSGITGNRLALACMVCALSCVISRLTGALFKSALSEEISNRNVKEQIEACKTVVKEDDDALLTFITFFIFSPYYGRPNYGRPSAVQRYGVWSIPQQGRFRGLDRYQDRVLMELAGRDQGRNSMLTNACVLPSSITSIPGIVKLIQAYANTFQPDTLRSIVPQLRNFGHGDVKDQLLRKYICEPKDSQRKNIREQVMMIIELSDQKEASLKLKGLYQFHREKSNHAELQDIIKAYINRRFCLFQKPDCVYDRYLETDLQGLDKIFYKLLVINFPPNWNWHPDFWT